MRWPISSSVRVGEKIKKEKKRGNTVSVQFWCSNKHDFSRHDVKVVLSTQRVVDSADELRGRRELCHL
jgi:hypothetical protein